ncbi:unnamed protein product [Symbiodinium sp. KB8]|nr:unnamed protein product [Symbiodinium sp. KB8]
MSTECELCRSGDVKCRRECEASDGSGFLPKCIGRASPVTAAWCAQRAGVRLDPEQDSFLAPEEDSERDAESGNEEMESKSVAKRAESGDGFRHAHGHLLGKGLDTSYETMLNERALSILFENTWWESHFDEGKEVRICELLVATVIWPCHVLVAGTRTHVRLNKCTLGDSRISFFVKVTLWAGWAVSTIQPPESIYESRLEFTWLCYAQQFDEACLDMSLVSAEIFTVKVLPVFTLPSMQELPLLMSMSRRLWSF